MAPITIKCSVIFLLTSCAINPFASASIYFEGNTPHVRIGGGILQGRTEVSRDDRPYSAFLGITYAEVSQRFKVSRLVQERWEGVRRADKPGNICPQPKRIFEYGADLVESENCLALNVYVPTRKNDSDSLPVMVWIHGGGFASGHALTYKPNFFLDEDIILVSINYRVGVFGFLSTGDTTIPGNNGLKDQINALRWVKLNIKDFGGDPERVTIFGESAGGASVHYLLLSPTSKGLFKRAISQSGTALGMWAWQPNPRKIAVELATHLNCKTSADHPSHINSQEILNCLRNLSFDELNKAQSTFKTSWPQNRRSFFFTPTTESAKVLDLDDFPFLTVNPFVAALSKEKEFGLDVPWLVGATKDEGCIFFSGLVLENEQLLQELDRNWTRIAPNAFDYEFLSNEHQNIVSGKIREFYFGEKSIGSMDTRDNLTNLISDQLVAHSVYKAAVETANRKDRNSPVFLYQYAYQGPISLLGATFKIDSSESKKVGHGDDLIHQFDLGINSLFSPEDQTFSRNFIKLWTSFAKTGYPTHSWGPLKSQKWSPISNQESRGPPLMWFLIDKNSQFDQVPDDHLKRMKFWDDLLQNDFLQSKHFSMKKTGDRSLNGDQGKSEL